MNDMECSNYVAALVTAYIVLPLANGLFCGFMFLFCEGRTFGKWAVRSTSVVGAIAIIMTAFTLLKLARII